MSEQGLFGAGSVAEGYREFLEPVIFKPWASRLLEFVDVQSGLAVLDVASGTGVVARAAAARVGAGGRVIASDISSEMLAMVNRGAETDGSAIETLECPATELAIPDQTVDRVVCQQGLPFIRDRPAAAREMRRVLRPEGRAAVSVWLSNPRVEPFIIYGEALRAHGLPEPFPNAYDTSATSMSVERVEAILLEAGFADVVVRTEELALTWSSPDAAARGAMGTPYGPVLARLDGSDRSQVLADIRDRMTAEDGHAVTHRTVTVLGRGTAP
ncbi:MAG: methyltransferase domain-containing protein [Solirubrobacteraceae bacterium]